jgi:hypothetical protein
VPDVLPLFGFDLPHPEQLGQREVSERRIAGELNQTLGSNGVFQVLHLLLRSLIAPDEGRAHHLVIPIQEDGTMHLPGKADAGNLVRRASRLLKHLSHRKTSRSPPVCRILFGPSWFRRHKWPVFLCPGAKHSALFVQDQGPGAARPDINSEESDSASFALLELQTVMFGPKQPTAKMESTTTTEM